MTPELKTSSWLKPAVGLFWALGIGLLVWLGWRFRDQILPYLADVDPERKSAVSHRGQAFRALRQHLAETA